MSVPLTRPATVQKNPDGTYSVRLQHDEQAGTISEVHFPNVVFAERLANGYAALLNGKAVVQNQLDKLASELKPVAVDAGADAKRLLAEAQGQADKLISAAEEEAVKLKKQALKFVEDAKADAARLVKEGKVEADKLVAAAKATIQAYNKPVVPATPPKTTVSEEDEA